MSGNSSRKRNGAANRTPETTDKTKQLDKIISIACSIAVQPTLHRPECVLSGVRYWRPHKIDFGSRKPSSEQEHGRRGKHRISHAKSRSDKQNSVDLFFMKVEPPVLRFRYHQPHYPLGDAAAFLIQRVTKAFRLWHGSLRVRILRFCFSADKALKAQSTG